MPVSGRVNDGFATAVFVWRGPVVRIIAMRRARYGEKKYQEVFGG